MNFQSVLAETFFSSTNFRLKGPSTYCIITPDDDKIPDSKKATWTKLARDAVLEWEEKLKDAESENDQLWEMKVRIVPQGEDIPSDCDIELSFKEKDFFTNTLVGVFSWPDNKIKIFYVQPQECALFIWCFYDFTMVSSFCHRIF